ncbi:zinc finger protein 510-like [Achroia grisella]|uniref:zinc finger protein 510-like n=1 Tax=Achroia grisella TaxID=688607 RepID=UPI0027D2FD47|nr:zinc finger protein 510-like [Achroia grisella]
MENYENAYKDICRVCLLHKDGEKFVPLIDKTSADGLSCFGKAVLNFANISLKKDDILPSFMCQKCLLLLKHAIYFKLKCESSQKRLSVLTNKTVNSDFSDDNFKEIIVEYSMFNQYFSSEDTEEFSRSNCSGNSEENSVIDSYPNINDHCNSNDDNDFVNEEEDSGEDLLDELDKLSDKFSSYNNVYYESHMKKKLFKRKKADQLHLARRRMQGRKRINKKIPNLTEKIVCKICDKILANQRTYDHHMQRHNGYKYMCEHCGKGFPVLVELQMHQVARHDTGPFLQCQHCAYKAPRKLNLIEHIRLHTGERPYTCDKCGLTFRRRALWRKHMVYHTEKTVQCVQCPKKFFRRGEMLAHVNSMHERMYMYLCHKCDATYAKPVTVRRHLTERHGIPREMQGKIIRINKGRTILSEQ